MKRDSTNHRQFDVERQRKEMNKTQNQRGKKKEALNQLNSDAEWLSFSIRKSNLNKT